MAKRFRSIGGLAALCLLLAACGQKDGYMGNQGTIASGDRIIRYVSSDLENQQPRLINELARHYEQLHPDVKYEFESVNTSDLVQKIQLLAASNDLPDLFAYESGRPLEQLSDNGFVLDIEKVFAELGMQDELNPAAVSLLKSMTHGDGLYALPLEMNIEGFWYNKQMFAEYGMREPRTWDELLRDADTFREHGIQPFALAGAEKWPITRLINGYVIREYGFDVMQRVDRGELKVTDPGFVKAADVVQRMALSGDFGENVTSTDLEEALEMFLQGQAAMYYTGSWSLRDFNDPSVNRIGEDRIGLFNIPLVDGGAGTEDDWLLNAGLTTSFSAKAYDGTMKQWIKSVFTGYGDKAMSELGLITGFKADRMPANLPPLTTMVQSKLENVKNGTLWFEALFSPETQSVAWNNAQLLISSPGYTPEMYMEDLQRAIDKQSPQ